MYRVTYSKFICLICSVFLTACTTTMGSLSLYAPYSHDRGTMSMSYTLAKGLIKIDLRVLPRTATFVVCVESPTPVEDDKYQYRLVWQNSWLAADKFEIKKNKDTNILNSIHLESQDLTDEFVVELASSFGAIGAGRILKSGSNLEGAKVGETPLAPCAAGAANTIATVYMDPASQNSVKRQLRRLNKLGHAFVNRSVDACQDSASILAATFLPGACKEYERLNNSYKYNGAPLVQLHWELPKSRGGKAFQTEDYETPDCTIGICYRALLPFTVTIIVGGGAPVSQLYMLPNSSPLIAMDISRGVAITKTTSIGFDHLGQPKRVFLRKGKADGSNGAEALELAKLPAQVVSAYFGSFAHTIKQVNTALGTPGEQALARYDVQFEHTAFLAVAQRKALNTNYIQPTYMPAFTMFADNSLYTSAIRPGD